MEFCLFVDILRHILVVACDVVERLHNVNVVIRRYNPQDELNTTATTT